MSGVERDPVFVLKILTGLLLLLWATTACDSFIEIVPRATPTSVPTPTPSSLPQPDALPAAAIPTQIIINAIDLDAPVVEMGWRVIEQNDQQVSEWEMPDDDAAWHKNSARPGQGSNVVISGHNASTGGQIFAELDVLEIGDEIVLKNDEEDAFTYHVTTKNIVRTFANSSQARAYLQTVTKATATEQLTLITCWPRWTNTHRLIITAELEPKPQLEARDAGTLERQ